MEPPPSHDPLHGVTLKQLLIELSGHYGWKRLADRIPIRCFQFDPTVNSSLKFLRQTPWARAKVEELYVAWKTGDGRSRSVARRPLSQPGSGASAAAALPRE